MKKMAMVLICVMVLAALAIGSKANATAANPGWYNITVTSVGALPAFNIYTITATSNDATWTSTHIFLLDSTIPDTKSALATALTAYSNGGLAAIYLPNSQATGTFTNAVNAGTLP